jgi:hypothetical protein
MYLLGQMKEMIMSTVLLGTMHSIVWAATGTWMHQKVKITLGIFPSWA